MHFRWSFVLTRIQIIIIVICASIVIEYVHCKTISANIIKNTAALLKNHQHLIEHYQTKSPLSRATTTSQVIEYNARNLVLMTLLNSVLILGGLLGSLNRPDAIGFGYKRFDLQNIKKRFWIKRRHNNNINNNGFNNNNNNNHNHNENVIVDSHLHSQSTLFEPFNSNNNKHFFKLDGSNGKQTTATTASNGPIENNYNNPYLNGIEYGIYSPQMLIKNERRRHDRSSSSDGQNCATIIQCMDGNGKPYYPSLSTLTKAALQLVNEDELNNGYYQQSKQQGQDWRKSMNTLIDKVKEMVEIEQKNICHWKQLCQLNR